MATAGTRVSHQVDRVDVAPRPREGRSQCVFIDVSVIVFAGMASRFR